MRLPTTMTAIAISEPGGPEVLKLQTRPMPQPAPGDLVIKVLAAGVNRPDLMQRSGQYPPPPGASDLPGLEVAGEVVALGEGSTRFRIGDRVCALTPGGGYAAYAATHEATTLPIPAGLSVEQAAALPETFFTVWVNVFMRSRLKQGETLLVHGGTSGIGTTAIMLGKAFGATVLTTVGSREKADFCLRLGADVAIDYTQQDFVQEVGRATNHKGADVILDMVGGDYIDRNYRAAAESGRIAQIAFQKGPKAEVDFTRLLMKRLVHSGSTLRPRTVAEKGEIARELEQKVWPLLAAGTVSPVIDRVFALADAAAAHRYLEGGTHMGKVVLDAASLHD
ncbi:NAD(P)H-quinone oxidoreductase [Lichenihabitans sp. PAMC28606]|uniref:NAD(P)H-quinone oxidoreductase n=1 Tax=Lichenihabitans sp. PAMC28606 TaxID=2880932 RepID=UPI001D09AE82|nr:NAD(P)H-quinone oxidoreductase [Lichenihabitans sp. PAMC28606]UDL96434.1 NAD(P)H-quinone oxidoreductase [Lichenihabitans sp. PAMC28606]